VLAAFRRFRLLRRVARSVRAVGPDLAILRAPVDVAVDCDETSPAIDVAAGDRLAFVLSYGVSYQPSPEPIDAKGRL